MHLRMTNISPHQCLTEVTSLGHIIEGLLSRELNEPIIYLVHQTLTVVICETGDKERFLISFDIAKTDFENAYCVPVQDKTRSTCFPRRHLGDNSQMKAADLRNIILDNVSSNFHSNISPKCQNLSK